jgi:hypothetical protein
MAPATRAMAAMVVMMVLRICFLLVFLGFEARFGLWAFSARFEQDNSPLSRFIPRIQNFI